MPPDAWSTGGGSLSPDQQKGPSWTSRCSPTTAGPASPTSSPRCSTDRSSRPPWLPAAAVGRRPGRAAGARRPRLGPARRSAATWRPRWRRWPAGRSPPCRPSTTATALTSITTGLAPGEHGVVGYRIAVDREVLNVLRWTTPGRRRPQAHRARTSSSPTRRSAASGRRIVTRAEFVSSGFTGAHLAEVRFHGYRMPSTLRHRGAPARRGRRAVRLRLLRRHRQGRARVRPRRALRRRARWRSTASWPTCSSCCPPGAALVVTADHGQVHVGDNIVDPHRDVLAHVSFQSGEGRFRWLHARPGREAALLEAARRTTATWPGSHPATR